jgi:serine/threonine-protein kinase RsbW
MTIKSGEFILYGLKDYNIVINKIIKTLNAKSIEFDLKLILTEGLSNAFKHGNKGDISLPIYLRYTFDGYEILFEIEDSGSARDFIILPKDTIGEDILEESGRGLFLINCYADAVHMEGNRLIIKKHLS